MTLYLKVIREHWVGEVGAQCYMGYSVTFGSANLYDLVRHWNRTHFQLSLWPVTVRTRFVLWSAEYVESKFLYFFKSKVISTVNLKIVYYCVYNKIS